MIAIGDEVLRVNANMFHLGFGGCSFLIVCPSASIFGVDCKQHRMFFVLNDEICVIMGGVGLGGAGRDNYKRCSCIQEECETLWLHFHKCP